jgi:hypothetical protein
MRERKIEGAPQLQLGHDLTWIKSTVLHSG